MAGLLDDGATLQEYFRRLHAFPVGDERHQTLDELSQQRALSGLRQEMASQRAQPQPAITLNALAGLGGVPAPQGAFLRPYPFAGTAIPGDFSNRIGGQPSDNIIDRRTPITWRDLHGWLGLDPDTALQILGRY